MDLGLVPTIRQKHLQGGRSYLFYRKSFESDIYKGISGVMEWWAIWDTSIYGNAATKPTAARRFSSIVLKHCWLLCLNDCYWSDGVKSILILNCCSFFRKFYIIPINYKISSSVILTKFSFKLGSYIYCFLLFINLYWYATHF